MHGGTDTAAHRTEDIPAHAYRSVDQDDHARDHHDVILHRDHEESGEEVGRTGDYKSQESHYECGFVTDEESAQSPFPGLLQKITS